MSESIDTDKQILESLKVRDKLSKTEEFEFKRPKRQLLKYFFIGVIISSIVVLLLSGIFILTLITVLK